MICQFYQMSGNDVPIAQVICISCATIYIASFWKSYITHPLLQLDYSYSESSQCKICAGRLPCMLMVQAGVLDQFIVWIHFGTDSELSVPSKMGCLVLSKILGGPPWKAHLKWSCTCQRNLYMPYTFRKVEDASLHFFLHLLFGSYSFCK